ncbi:MAG: acyltransferase [Roseburia inulinivorans]
MEKRGRNSGLELLRIIALLLTFWMHGASSYSNNELSAWLCIIIESIGNIGVTIFILISGYFSVKLKPLKLIQLDLMLVFYCWIGLILRFLWGEAQSYSGEQILSYIFPIIGRNSWYFTCYFALALLSPFLNEFIEKISQNQFKKMLLTMLIIFSGVTTFCFFDITQDGGKGIVNMVLVYFIGRYIYLYKDDVAYKQCKVIGVYVLLTIGCIALNGMLYIATGTMQNRFARDNTLFTIFESVCIFLVFKQMNFKSVFINQMAIHVPAVFTMEWTLRGIITYYLFDYLAWKESNWHEIILFGISILLILMGTCIDIVRLKIFGKIEKNFSNKVFNQLEKIYAIIDRKYL